jgi:hypothetical protein
MFNQIAEINSKDDEDPSMILTNQALFYVRETEPPSNM